MDYTEGKKHMLSLSKKLPSGKKDYFNVNTLKIDYPGYKKPGDYRLSRNGVAPTHVDVVNLIYQQVTAANSNDIIDALEDIYNFGLNSTHPFFPLATKQLIYWITLQEEINYPQPQFAGRKLPFQRYYEAILSKLGQVPIQGIYNRTNNHGGRRPNLLQTNGVKRPIFYN